MAFHVYILRCNDTSYYVGHTDNIEKRISEHEQGLVPGYTYSRRPIIVVFVEEFGSRPEALEAEFVIKKWSRSKKEALIANDWQTLSLCAKKNFIKP